MLREHGAAMTNRELYEVALVAYGDQRKAEKLRIRRIEEELRRGETPQL